MTVIRTTSSITSINLRFMLPLLFKSTAEPSYQHGCRTSLLQHAARSIDQSVTERLSEAYLPGRSDGAGLKTRNTPVSDSIVECVYPSSRARRRNIRVMLSKGGS
jgi:hypothetical protein